MRAGVDLLIERGFRPGSIGLHGTSYGAATTLLAAAIIPEVGAVVADSAFADARELMDKEIEKITGVPAQIARFLRPGLSIVAKSLHALDLALITPLRAVPAIAPRPILFIHGGNDDVISPDHSHQLMDTSNAATNELWIIPQLGHTEAVRRLEKGCEPTPASETREIYLERVTAFFDRWLR